MEKNVSTKHEKGMPELTYCFILSNTCLKGVTNEKVKDTWIMALGAI